jgi:predicted  nucleic acid-binding Zn-ribbon protein
LGLGNRRIATHTGAGLRPGPAAIPGWPGGPFRGATLLDYRLHRGLLRILAAAAALAEQASEPVITADHIVATLALDSEIFGATDDATPLVSIVRRKAAEAFPPAARDARDTGGKHGQHLENRLARSTVDRNALQLLHVARGIAVATNRTETIEARHLLAAARLAINTIDTPFFTSLHGELGSANLDPAEPDPLEGRAQDRLQAGWKRVDDAIQLSLSSPAGGLSAAQHLLHQPAVKAALPDARIQDEISLTARAGETPAPADEPVAAASPAPNAGDAAEDVAPGPDEAAAARQRHFETVLEQLLSDKGSDTDRLNIMPEVDAFARLIADRKTPLPLAIGLFGKWGAGKTFFMDRLRERIGELSETAVTDEQFVGRVVNIEFNAWHYMEADIWASLADHMFRELQIYLVDKQDEAKEFEALIKALDSWGALETDAEERAAQARQRVDEIEEELKPLRTQEKTTGGQICNLAAAVWSTATSGSISNEIGQAADAAGQHFALPDLDRAKAAYESSAKTLQDARQTATEIKLIGERLTSLGALVTRSKIGPLAWAVVAVLIAGIVSVTVAYPDVFDTVAGAVAQVSALALVGLSWMRMQARRAQGLLTSATTVVEKIVTESEHIGRDQQPEIEALEKQLAKTQSEIRDHEAQQAAARKHVEEIESEMRARTPGERLRTFIADRAASDDYQNKLGTLALLRRDFETLSKLLNPVLDKDTKAQLAKRLGPEAVMPKIDRIVLHIDDLDRCPAGRVVEILQAVHLLLAFPLFIVVVAIDARWAKSSLWHHMARLEEGNNGRASTPPVTATSGATDTGESTSEKNRGLTGPETSGATPGGVLGKDYPNRLLAAAAGQSTDRRFLGDAGRQPDSGAEQLPDRTPRRHDRSRADRPACAADQPHPARNQAFPQPLRPVEAGAADGSGSRTDLETPRRSRAHHSGRYSCPPGVARAGVFYVSTLAPKPLTSLGDIREGWESAVSAANVELLRPAFETLMDILPDGDMIHDLTDLDFAALSLWTPDVSRFHYDYIDLDASGESDGGGESAPPSA